MRKRQRFTTERLKQIVDLLDAHHIKRCDNTITVPYARIVNVDMSGNPFDFGDRGIANSRRRYA